MTKIDELVSRFLTWPVPADVYPDGEPGKPGRTGTNLMTHEQARQMLTHVLGDVLSEAAKSERLHYPCRMCGGTGAAPPQADENDWCQHCAATGREPSKVDDELLLSLWDETAGRDDRVLAFGFAVAQHVAMVCRMDGA